MLRALALALVLLAVLVPPAAATDDLALGETEHAEIAVWGTTVAWRAGSSAVLRTPDGLQRTFAWRGDSTGMTLGPDAVGRLVLLFPFCTTRSSCRLRRVDVRSGRASFVRGLRTGSIADPVLRRGILMWRDAVSVRSRPLAGGRVRREHLGRGRLEVTGLDHDGRRFAVTGQGEDDPSTETSYTEVRVGRIGARSTRYVGGLGSSQEYQAVVRPLLSATAVDVFKDDLETFTAGDAYLRLLRYPLGRERRVQRSFGVPFVAMARGGGGTALVQAPGPEGCAVATPSPDDDIEGPSSVAAPCRVVLAGAAPFSGTRRRTVPEISFARTADRVTGRVVRRTIDPATGGTSRTQGVADVPVGVAQVGRRDRGLVERGTGARTDAAGRFALPLAGALLREPVVALTTTAPRAFAPATEPAPED